MRNSSQPSFLKSEKQLPEIEDESFQLEWDFNFSEQATVIKFGDTVIWKEPVIENGYLRFREVGGILKSKYGKQLIDLVPHERSFDWLLGEPWKDISRSRKLIQNHGLPGTFPGIPNPLYWKCEACGQRIPRHPVDKYRIILFEAHDHGQNIGNQCNEVLKAGRFKTYWEWEKFYLKAF